MARRCELTGKGVLRGHNVSHANNKTRRVFLPNLAAATLTSEALNQRFRLRVTTHALRTVDHRGGFDAFLRQQPDHLLSPRALRIKRAIEKKTLAAA